jgi:hypothetical protein
MDMTQPHILVEAAKTGFFSFKEQDLTKIKK